MPDQKPQRLDYYMEDCLSRYYDSRDPFGVDGDFITAPEISQLFGEIIGIWVAQKWEAMGRPSSFNLIELGPGRGTLMSDLLRGTENIKGFHEAANTHLIEISSSLKAKQKETLSDYNNVSWHDHLDEVQTNTPSIIIANEFFDALPVRQFRLINKQWNEHVIINNETAWKTIPTDEFSIKSTLRTAQDGDIFEYSDAQKEYANLMSKHHGAFLIIDYGYFKSAYGDTLQALHKHAPCKITEHAGEADITTHIDFEWLASQFTDATIEFSTQANFLRTYGIDIRYHLLGRNKMGSGYHRLMDDDKMGQLFKVMEVEKFSIKND